MAGRAGITAAVKRIGDVNMSALAAVFMAVVAWFSKGKQKFKEDER